MNRKRLLSILLVIPFLLATFTQLAPSFKDISDISARKKAFIDFIEPEVKAVNARIEANRGRVLALYAQVKKGQPLSTTDDEWVRGLALTHRVTNFDSARAQSFEALLIRVDTIPLSLALAQAACESGWGTSYMARTLNNYFGHYCFGCGPVDPKTKKKKRMQPKRFESAAHAVEAYAMNLNSHPAYKKVWQIRAQMRKEGKSIDGAALADGLHSYSELGSRYVQYIKKMIRKERLEKAKAKTA